MKIISRGVGEQLIIDEQITVTVKEMDDEKIILSVDSAQDFPHEREIVISLENGMQLSTLETVSE